ncbi:hypothetical protein NGI46_13530 [Peribacillus butanolivorans]|nr:hypothetical protein [Peribacillus butanolivorans]
MIHSGRLALKGLNSVFVPFACVAAIRTFIAYPMIETSEKVLKEIAP